ncbi:Putative uncharacterized transposon-derived protein [Frankliniella fusca]|uniref:Uncharacterized transposon-derived protein n=1 Tax=Frankliniella fusca TaxID=407009 RepID=A0AAE1LHR0_9NEOP|nr:Putative uncharacterized transposon-derived protein [Frankliniella fusca]
MAIQTSPPKERKILKRKLTARSSTVPNKILKFSENGDSDPESFLDEKIALLEGQTPPKVRRQQTGKALLHTFNMAENLNELLWKLYTKPPSKSLFRSKETLRKNTNLKDSVLENFLLKQPVYTTFRSARRRFPTHGYDTLSKSGQLMQLDLLDLSKFSSENDGVRQNQRYIDALGDLVKSYNSSTHRSTGFAPESVKKKNFYQIWSKRMLASYRNRIKERPPKFRIGDTVKVSVIRSSVFAKRTERNFSEENFTVVDIVLKRPKNIYLYTLKDSTGEIIEGGFYEYELTKALVDKETRYKIRSILGYKSIGGVKHALVWWEGFPRKAATFEPVSNLEAYNV